MSSALETEIAKLRAEIAELSAGARKAGHDLNNVLQALICEAERLADSDLPRAQVISETILAAVTRGEELTRALLAAGHASARPVPLASMPALPAAVASFTYGPARILVVEDQEQNSDFLWKILQTAGHTVVVAGNGAEAVAAIELAPFDLVLMDIEMPLMDGLAATRAIRRMEGIGARVPVVALSGNVCPEQVLSFREAGMNDHIGKPFKRAALLRKVDSWLGRDPAPARALPETAAETEFDEICALMGRPWALRGLARLTAQIDEAFGSVPGKGERDIEQDGRLARQAHALVSLSSLLGFRTLSRLCGELEQACKSDLDVPSRFAQAKLAAAQAHATAAGLIAAG